MEQVRLIIAVLLSTLILFMWQYFAVKQQPVNNIQRETLILDDENILQDNAIMKRDDVLRGDFENRRRVEISNQYVSGSINLHGAKFDDLSLLEYKEQISHDERVVMFSPQKTEKAYFAEFGWLSNDQFIDLPNYKTIWDICAQHNSQEVSLCWTNKNNVKFFIDFKLDEHYMINITKRIENNTKDHMNVYSYSSIARSFAGDVDNAVVHEGAIAVFDEKLYEFSFKELSKETLEKKQQQGWIGFSDKYWLASLMPESTTLFKAKMGSENDQYQVDLLKNRESINPGEKVSDIMHIFVGPKKINLLHEYQDKYNISLFDRAVDFGFLYFITKPLFMLLNYFYGMVGNLGMAILVLTIFIKILLFPLAYKGFVNMNRLKILQPQLASIKEKHGDDAIAFQKAVMAMYKKEKVNPMSGCLPLVLQMPVFFALYKVLSVTIEMRHAPFFGWIKDLSVPDPTTIFNLFGIFPWSMPSFLMIGVFPIAMAMTMHIQQALNPAPTDPVQAKVMRYLPLIFLFVFSSFPSGLVIYWTMSNILSIIQQVIIKRITS